MTAPTAGARCKCGHAEGEHETTTMHGRQLVSCQGCRTDDRAWECGKFRPAVPAPSPATSPVCDYCNLPEAVHIDAEGWHAYVSRENAGASPATSRETGEDAALGRLMLDHAHAIVDHWDKGDNAGRKEAPMVFARMQGAFVEALRARLAALPAAQPTASIVVDPSMPPGTAELRDNAGRTLGTITNILTDEPHPAAAQPTGETTEDSDKLVAALRDRTVTYYRTTLVDNLFRRAADRIATLESALAASQEAGERSRQAVRREAREDLFDVLSVIADAMDIAANGPNRPLHRRSLHAVAIPMGEILKAIALCEANDAAISTPTDGDAHG